MTSSTQRGRLEVRSNRTQQPKQKHRHTKKVPGQNRITYQIEYATNKTQRPPANHHPRQKAQGNRRRGGCAIPNSPETKRPIRQGHRPFFREQFAQERPRQSTHANPIPRQQDHGTPQSVRAFYPLISKPYASTNENNLHRGS